MSDHAPPVGVPRASLLLVAAGGLMALGGTYWDDAFHTHVGRDEFASPPHLLLYAGVVVALAGVWWWAAVTRRGGPRAWRTDRALVLAGAGGLTTLASGPIDEVWHTAFGRDAVLWSPPHMLGVVGMFALAAGVLAGAARGQGRRRWVWVVLAGTAVLGATVIPVMEYEADVPQFGAIWYLPVLTAGLVLAFTLIERADESWATVPTVAAVYTALRAVVVGFLTLLGYSAPFVPPLLVPALAFAATRRLAPLPRALVVSSALVMSYAPAMNLVFRGVRLSGRDLVVGGAMSVAVAALLLRTATERKVGRDLSTRTGTVAALLVVLLLLPVQALAHDPGQGEPVAPIRLTATAREGHARMHAVIDHPNCATVSPSSTVARRGGRAHTGHLVERGPCTFQGEVQLDGPGRWFLYVEFTDAADDAILEAWLPITPPDAAGSPPVTERKTDWAYLPAGSDHTTTVQLIGGTLLYALAGCLLVLAIRTRPRMTASR